MVWVRRYLGMMRGVIISQNPLTLGVKVLISIVILLNLAMTLERKADN